MSRPVSALPSLLLVVVLLATGCGGEAMEETTTLPATTTTAVATAMASSTTTTSTTTTTLPPPPTTSTVPPLVIPENPVSFLWEDENGETHLVVPGEVLFEDVGPGDLWGPGSEFTRTYIAGVKLEPYQVPGTSDWVQPIFFGVDPNGDPVVARYRAFAGALAFYVNARSSGYPVSQSDALSSEYRNTTAKNLAEYREFLTGWVYPIVLTTVYENPNDSDELREMFIDVVAFENAILAALRGEEITVNLSEPAVEFFPVVVIVGRQ